jgi:hypothetical protein
VTEAAKTAIHAEVYAGAAKPTFAQAGVETLRLAARDFLYGSPAATATQAAMGGASVGLPAIDAAADTSHALKIEREAQLAIETRDVPGAATGIVALVEAQHGFVTKDERSNSGQWNADLIVRVPAAGLDAFLDALARIGVVKSRRITAIDATLEHRDVEILLSNLEAALTRYRDLLQRATDPAQVLAIERELERVRTEVDRVKGRLELLRDRVAFATVAVALREPAPLAPPEEPTAYQAGIATGVRGISFVDVRESGTNGYLGAGLSLRFPRSAGDSGRGWAFDVDVMRASFGGNPARSAWAYDALIGLDLFSESLESGRRRWLNPYLGARMGVAQTQDKVDFAAAAVLGLEIVKTRLLLVAVEARLVALVGNPDGPHGGVQPLLGVDLGL